MTRSRLLGDCVLKDGEMETNADGRKTVRDAPIEYNGIDSLGAQNEQNVHQLHLAYSQRSRESMSELMNTLGREKG